MSIETRKLNEEIGVDNKIYTILVQYNIFIISQQWGLFCICQLQNKLVLVPNP